MNFRVHIPALLSTEYDFFPSIHTHIITVLAITEDTEGHDNGRNLCNIGCFFLEGKSCLSSLANFAFSFPCDKQKI